MGGAYICRIKCGPVDKYLRCAAVVMVGGRSWAGCREPAYVLSGRGLLLVEGMTLTQQQARATQGVGAVHSV